MKKYRQSKIVRLQPNKTYSHMRYYAPEDLSNLLSKLNIKHDSLEDKNYVERVNKIVYFLIKVALKYLPPVQRRTFYFVWCRTQGRLSKTFEAYSNNKHQSYSTSYGNYKKAINNIKIILKKTGYEKYIILYLRNEL